jgi:hypothetical protein
MMRAAIRRFRRAPLPALFAAPRIAEIGLSPDGRWVSRVESTSTGATLTVSAAEPGDGRRPARRHNAATPRRHNAAIPR